MRAMAPKLQERLGKPIVIENRVGAGGNIAAAAVAKAPPDGQTLLAPASSLAATRRGRGNLSRRRTVPEHDRDQDERRRLPRRAAGFNDVMAGHVAVMFADAGSVVAQINAGRVRALGVSSTARVPALPDVPTIAESGVPGFDAVGWTMICAPSATPKPVIDRLY